MHNSSYDVDALLALNAAHEIETSPITAQTVEPMLRHAFYLKTLDRGRQAFLLAFDQDAPYKSENFLWFRARYPRFVYIDRVIVAKTARRSGFGRMLYRDLFVAVSNAGHSLICCEVNAVPPNPASLAFHEALGFKKAGQALVAGGVKTVIYMTCAV